jgi:hypothetical protein
VGLRKQFLLLTLLAAFLFSSAFTGLAGVYASSVKEARRRAEEKLLPLEGIVGVSHIENPPKIIVYIEHDKYRDKVPSNVDGFKTEVIVTGKLKALSLLRLEETVKTAYTYSGSVSRTGVVKPLVGGVSIGVPEAAYGGKMAGTLGIVANDPEGRHYILSNAHVMAMNSKAAFLPLGTAVLQPGTYDGGTDKVGELYKYIKITFGPKGKNYADAAIAKIIISEYLIGEVLGSDNTNTYSVSGVADVKAGEIVRKSGRTTGVTASTVASADATVKVWYTVSKWAIFYDQILVNQLFIESGDSGSAVDKGGAFVGLAFAGSSSVAVVCKAKYIAAELGVSF